MKLKYYTLFTLMVCFALAGQAGVKKTNYTYEVQTVTNYIPLIHIMPSNMVVSVTNREAVTGEDGTVISETEVVTLQTNLVFWFERRINYITNVIKSVSDVEEVGSFSMARVIRGVTFIVVFLLGYAIGLVRQRKYLNYLNKI